MRWIVDLGSGARLQGWRTRMRGSCCLVLGSMSVRGFIWRSIVIVGLGLRKPKGILLLLWELVGRGSG